MDTKVDTNRLYSGHDRFAGDTLGFLAKVRHFVSVNAW